jgi:hypothetical protein
MPSWLTIALFCGLLSAGCIAADRFMLNRQKIKLYDLLSTFWLKLSDTRFPELHIIVASQTTQFIRKRFRENKILFFIFLVTLSTAITASAVLLGFHFEHKFLEFGSVARKCSIWIKEKPPIFFVIMFFINMIFDLATFFSTYIILKIIIIAKLPKVIFLIFLDILIALFIAYSGMYTFTVVSTLILEFRLLPFRTLVGLLDPRSIFAIGSFMFGVSLSDPDGILTIICYSLTSLIPTALYMIFLLFLLLAKPVLYCARYVFLHFLEKSTEPTPEKIAPFTLLAVVLNLFAIIAKTVDHFLTS